MVLIMYLHCIRLDSIINIFKLITKIKKIRLKGHNYDLTDMLNDIYEQRDILMKSTTLGTRLTSLHLTSLKQ